MRTIERWTLIEELSRGGFGTVWRALGPDGRPAALKLLDPLEAARSPGRFLREVEALRAVRHPGVVGILGAGTDQGTPWVAMELIAGETLAARLERTGRLPAGEAVRRAIEIGAALRAIHAAGLVHRDLKPENVMIEAATGRVVLVDFGLVFTPAGHRLTLAGELLGTPAYMAPEQVRGDPDAGPAIDVYGLGAVLYALLTGAPPFGTGPAGEVFARALTTAPAPPSTRGGVPPWLDPVLARMLARDPAERPGLDAALEMLRLGRAPRGGPSLASLVTAGGFLLVGLIAAWVLLGRAPAAIPAPLPVPASLEPPSPTPLVLQPGPFEGQDTYVTDVGYYVNDNYGAHGFLEVGARQAGQTGDFRALLRFELRDRLPPGAEVTSASLELETNGGPALVLRVHRASAPWVEGSSTNDQRLDGVAWDGDHRCGKPAADSGRPDLTQPPLGELLIEVALQEDQRLVTIPLTETVREWQRAPATNHGVCLTHAGEGPPWSSGKRAFLSSDSRETARRPRLRIEYRGAAAPDHTVALEEERRRSLALAHERLESVADPSTSYADVLMGLDEACRLAPDWSRPFLLRTRLFAGRSTPTARPDLEGALLQLDLALHRSIDDEEFALARETLIDVVESVLASNRADFLAWIRRIFRTLDPRLLDQRLRDLQQSLAPG